MNHLFFGVKPWSEIRVWNLLKNTYINVKKVFINKKQSERNMDVTDDLNRRSFTNFIIQEIHKKRYLRKRKRKFWFKEILKFLETFSLYDICHLSYRHGEFRTFYGSVLSTILTSYLFSNVSINRLFCQRCYVS